ncbi:EAL domain-containing protein [Bacillus timonensis]|uniref:EAL domain-containing protein n=1 Tax=Bacillus timonensis TaxID=1033734 RepID=UPI0002898BD9|nr:EAL domain-containing protein [Bacillus timonensis]
MISIFMSEYNISYTLFSIFIALTSSIICFDIALNIVPKSNKQIGVLWAILAAFTFSLGTKTAFLVGISGLIESSTLGFRVPGVALSFTILFATSFLGIILLIKRTMPFIVAGILFTIGSSAAYFIISISNNTFFLSFSNKWFLLGVFSCFLFSTVGSFFFKKELRNNTPSKKWFVGLFFGISIIVLHHTSTKGLKLMIVGHPFSGGVIVPYLLLSVYLFMFIAFLGNRYHQKLQAEQLKWRSQERYYRSLYELNPLAIIMLDPSGKVININEMAERVAMMDKKEVLGKHFSCFLPEHVVAFTNQQFETALTGEVVEYEIQMYNASGEIIDVYVRNIPIALDNQIHGIYGMIKDITEEKRNMEKVQFMAYHAPLTNLPSKRKLVEDVSDKIGNRIPFSLIYLDLNGFKKTNDRYGHLAGDAVLKEIAKRLKENDNDGVAYHIGGDEFAITLPVVNYAEIETIVDALSKVIRQPITFHDFTLMVFASIGIARFPDDAKSMEELMQRADLAMYASKEHGRGELVFYHETLLKRVEERFLIEQDLKQALKNQEFEIYFQPQVEIRTGKLHGAEALLRWNHPQKGMLQPEVFIHVLEDTGLIVDVSEWIISQVLDSIHTWANAGCLFNHISVNVSAKHFEKHSLFNFIQDANKGSEICLQRLNIEITESVLINLDKSIESVKQLKKLGISISLDDFGTGYSSLSVLHQLPIDCLKIDKSFIKNFNTDSKILIQMILQMAKKLNVEVVAEGIETKQQLTFLIKEGCTYGQGYYFSKPLPRAEFEQKWLKK